MNHLKGNYLSFKKALQKMMVTENQARLEQSKYQSKVTDEILIEQFLETQNSKYFDQLYAKYAKKIFSKCIGLLKNPKTAEEVTQEILLKIFLNLSAFEGKSKFATWVYGITYNACIDLLREREKDGKIFSDEMEQATPVEEVPDNFLLDLKVSQLRVVLDNIPVGDKAILLMKYQENMSLKEISTILNQSESTIKLKLNRAKQKAKTTYEAKFQPTFSKITSINLEAVEGKYAFN